MPHASALTAFDRCVEFAAAGEAVLAERSHRCRAGDAFDHEARAHRVELALAPRPHIEILTALKVQALGSGVPGAATNTVLNEL
jgi:hypothetical protein